MNPPAVQTNTFPAVNGLQELRLGQRDAITSVSGIIGGAIGLDVAQSIFRSYYNNKAYVLVDTNGDSWDFIKMASFNPSGRVIRDQFTGFQYQNYTAEFRHILLPGSACLFDRDFLCLWI